MKFTLQPVKGEDVVNRNELLYEMVTELNDKTSTEGYALYGKRMTIMIYSSNMHSIFLRNLQQILA